MRAPYHTEENHSETSQLSGYRTDSLLRHATQLRILLFALFALATFTAAIMLTGCEFDNLKDQEYGPVQPGSGDPNDTTGNGGNDTGTANITLTVAPTSATINEGQTAQFTATVTGSVNTAVTWIVEAGPGSISTNGLYQAPGSVQGQVTVATVRAISSANTAVTANATVVITPVETGSGGDTAKDGEMCFQRDILPIFQSNCAKSGCHDVGTRQKGFAFVDYDGVLRGIDPGRPDNSEIYEKITEDRSDKRMPPPPNTPLTSAQIASIRQWIQEGARNTICPPETGSCDTVNITYSATVRPILDKYCIGCHSGTNPPKGINLTVYGDVRTVALDGRLRGVTARLPGYTPMPFGGNKLPDCEIDQLSAWANKGAQND